MHILLNFLSIVTTYKWESPLNKKEAGPMEITAQQVWSWIGQHLWQIIVFGSLFIQIAPIKINPWSALFTWIGEYLTGDI